MAREVELDETDDEILEEVFDDDTVAELLEDYDESKVKGLMEKLGLDFPDLSEEDDEDDGVEDE